jgi:hypothetical protein
MKAINASRLARRNHILPHASATPESVAKPAAGQKENDAIRSESGLPTGGARKSRVCRPAPSSLDLMQRSRLELRMSHHSRSQRLFCRVARTTCCPWSRSDRRRSARSGRPLKALDSPRTSCGCATTDNKLSGPPDCQIAAKCDFLRMDARRTKTARRLEMTIARRDARSRRAISWLIGPLTRTRRHLLIVGQPDGKRWTRPSRAAASGLRGRQASCLRDRAAGLAASP